MNHANRFRILSIALTTRGFGYSVMEGEHSLIVGAKTVMGKKNIRSLGLIEKMIVQYRPNMLILSDVNAKGNYRWPRIKKLHYSVLDLAKQRKLKTAKISGIDVRHFLLGDPKGTKHEIAELLANMFPDELASRLPPKRKWWNSEDGRMDVFDATALIVASRMKESKN